MRADLTRGHRPDGKRGKSYRRVLLQQNRLLLDSDWAALVDAIDGQFRKLSGDLGCAAGSPDLGFLVTPGPLLAVFHGTANWSADAAPFRARRDYQHKYLDRFPSLYLSGAQTAGGVDVAGRSPVSKADFPILRIWARTGATVHVEVDGVAAPDFSGTDPVNFVAYDVALPASVPAQYRDIRLDLDLGSGNEAWIGLIEGFQEAEASPHFWVTGGTYYLGGLVGGTSADARYPEATFPAGLGWQPPDAVAGGATRFLAYLEMFERHITAVHDSGLQEQALGGTVDTTTRTVVVPLVKVVQADGATAEEIRSSVRSIAPGAGRLTVDVISTIQKTDPCAVPEVSGYSGDTNRMYWMEVHADGPLGTALLKWSRDNGSDLARVTEVSSTGQVLTLAPGFELEDGSVVEFLGEAIELGDESPAELAGGSFTPSRRRVGRLFVVERVPGSSAVSGLQVKLLDRATLAPATLTQAELNVAGDPSTFKVRRWHGVLETQPPDPATSMFAATLEDGIAVKLSGGPFRVGDWWQFEVRRDQENANGPWREAPHGPERLFAPLALLDHKDPNAPVEIVTWFDEAFSALCELTADGIAYDGASADSHADTVQEAIDELFGRDEGCCCDASISPGPGGADDAVRIGDLIQARIPTGGSVCLRAGVYHFGSPLEIIGIPVALHGCPDATIAIDFGAESGAFQVSGSGRLHLENLGIVASGAHAGLEALVHIADSAGAFSAAECGLVHGDGSSGATVIRVGSATIDAADLAKVLEPAPTATGDLYRFVDSPSGPVTGAPSVSLRDCTLLGSWGLVGDNLEGLDVNGSLILGVTGGCAIGAVRRAEVSGSAFDTSVQAAELTAVATASPAHLEGELRELAEGSRPPGTGFPAFFEWVRGSIQDSTFDGRTGIWAALASGLRLEDNVVWATHTGIRMDKALDSRVKGGEVAADAIGIHVPLTAKDTAIESVAVLYSRRGMVLGADSFDAPVSPPQRSVEFVQIQNSQVEATGVGIQLGRGDGLIENGWTERVQVLDNAVQFPRWEKDSDNSGIIATTLGGGGDPETSINIAGNGVDGFKIGVLARGTGTSISDNRIRVRSGSDLTIGIRLDNTQRSVVEGNVVEFALPSQPNSQGISIEKGVGLRLSDNVIRSSGGQETPITATGTVGLELVGNSTGLGASTMSGLTRLTMRANQIEGAVTLAGKDGVVSDNLLTGGAVSLTVAPASGQWQVEGNRVGGTLAVRPALAFLIAPPILEVEEFEVATGFLPVHRARYSFGGVEDEPLFAYDLGTASYVYAAGESPVSAADAPVFRPREYVPLAAGLEVAAEAAEEAPMLSLGVGEINAVLDAGGDVPAAIEAVSTEATNAVHMALISEIGGLVERVGGVSVEADPGFGPIIFPLVERAYEVQVQGNWAGALHIGYAAPGQVVPAGITTHSAHGDSVVQVVANRTAGLLVVNDYNPHLVMGLNIAATYVGPATPTTGRILSPNHRVT